MAGYCVDGHKYGMIKLNDTNYYHWKFAIEMMLLKEGLWDVVTGVPPSPRTTEWKRKDETARGSIALSMEPSQTSMVRHCTTSAEMWNSIKKVKENSCMASKRNLKRQITNLKKDQNLSMTKYINEMMELIDRLAALGEETTEEQHISDLLGGLPEEYDYLITSLESIQDSNLNLTYVKSRLLEEETRKLSRKKEWKEEKLLYNHENVKDSKKCYYCGSFLHIKRNCPEFKKTNRQNYQSQSTTRKMDSRSMLSEQHKDDEENDNMEHVYTAFTGIENQGETKQSWIIDSGANAHMTGDFKYFTDYFEFDAPQAITLADGKCLYANGRGNCVVELLTKAKTPCLKLLNTLYVPKMPNNLMSVNKICDAGLEVIFTKQHCRIMNDEGDIVSGNKTNGLFTVDCKTPNQSNKPDQANYCLHDWHEKLGHRSLQSIKNMSDSNKVRNFKITACDHKNECISCTKTGLVNKPYNSNEKYEPKISFERLSADICGPITPLSFGGAKYFLTMQDNFSKYTYTYVLKRKNQAADCIIELLTKEANRFGRYPVSFRTDGGGEFENDKLNSFFTEKGISHELIIPYCPQQNGEAERKNATLIRMVKSMIAGKGGLPKELWGEAVCAATFIYN